MHPAPQGAPRPASRHHPTHPPLACAQSLPTDVHTPHGLAYSVTHGLPNRHHRPACRWSQVDAPRSRQRVRWRRRNGLQVCHHRRRHTALRAALCARVRGPGAQHVVQLSALLGGQVAAKLQQPLLRRGQLDRRAAGQDLQERRGAGAGAEEARGVRCAVMSAGHMWGQASNARPFGGGGEDNAAGSSGGGEPRPGFSRLG